MKREALAKCLGSLPTQRAGDLQKNDDKGLFKNNVISFRRYLEMSIWIWFILRHSYIIRLKGTFQIRIRIPVLGFFTI